MVAAAYSDVLYKIKDIGNKIMGNFVRGGTIAVFTGKTKNRLMEYL